MKRIAKFHKVSKERFVADWMDTFEGVSADEAEKIYEGIRLPRRATAGSAGYDFFPRLILPLSQERPSRFRPGSVWRWIRSGC